MSCGAKESDRDSGKNVKTTDCCQPAVMRAYQEMRACGQPDRYCAEAALAVFRWHHPEVPSDRAYTVVADWIAVYDCRQVAASLYH